MNDDSFSERRHCCILKTFDCRAVFGDLPYNKRLPLKCYLFLSKREIVTKCCQIIQPSLKDVCILLKK